MNRLSDLITHTLAIIPEYNTNNDQTTTSTHPEALPSEEVKKYCTNQSASSTKSLKSRSGTQTSNEVKAIVGKDNQAQKTLTGPIMDNRSHDNHVTEQEEFHTGYAYEISHYFSDEPKPSLQSMFLSKEPQPSLQSMFLSDEPKPSLQSMFLYGRGESSDPSTESLDALKNEQFPDEIPHFNSMSSLTPEHTETIETNSMVYILHPSQKLQISYVEIDPNSSLAEDIGVSGQIKVDKVFFEPGTNAIFVEISNGEETVSFTIAYINNACKIRWDEKHLEISKTAVLAKGVECIKSENKFDITQQIIGRMQQLESTVSYPPSREEQKASSQDKACSHADDKSAQDLKKITQPLKCPKCNEVMSMAKAEVMKESWDERLKYINQMQPKWFKSGRKEELLHITFNKRPPVEKTKKFGPQIWPKKSLTVRRATKN